MTRLALSCQSTQSFVQRIVGLAVHQETLKSYTDILMIKGLQFIVIQGEVNFNELKIFYHKIKLQLIECDGCPIQIQLRTDNLNLM